MFSQIDFVINPFSTIRRYTMHFRPVQNLAKSAWFSHAASHYRLILNYSFLKRTGHTLVENGWTLDKPMDSLSTCHLGVLPSMAILFNLDGTVLFEQLLNIAR